MEHIRYTMFDRIDSECTSNKFVFDYGSCGKPYGDLLTHTADEVLVVFNEYLATMPGSKITCNEMGIVFTESNGRILAIALNNEASADEADAASYAMEYEHIAA